jgi:OOP family OmpA-OmpF porin
VSPNRLSAALALAVLAIATRASATDCTPSSGISTCFDADNLWATAGRTRFASIAPATLPAPGALASVFLLSYLSRPVQLNAPSPDPDGRDIRVVDKALNLSLGFAYAVDEDWELTLASPVTLWQSGAGAEGVTSQSAPPLGRAAVHDPRLGAGMRLPLPPKLARAGLSAKGRFEVGLPLGDDDRYVGSGGLTLAPSLALGASLGRVHLGGELGARLRRAVPFATARVGSELLSSFGVAVDIVAPERLTLGAEAFVLPTLVEQPGSSHVSDGILAPAEWLFTVRSVPFSDPGFAVALSGGTGIPLSSETRDGSAERYAGVTTPRFRAALSLRYTPSPEPPAR